MGCCQPNDSSGTSESTVQMTALGDTVAIVSSTTVEEDHTLQSAQDTLLYHKHKSLQLCQTFDTYTEQGKIAPQKFHGLAQELGLNTADIDEEDSPMKLFYRKFREGNRFDATKLKVLAVLLGQGSAGEKAGLYFDTFAKDRIDLERIQELLGLIFTVSVDFLPILAVKPGGMSQKDYIELSFFLGGQKEPVRDRLANVLVEFKQDATRKEFITRFQEDAILKRLCSPTSVRKLLETEAGSISAPQLTPGQ